MKRSEVKKVYVAGNYKGYVDSFIDNEVWYTDCANGSNYSYLNYKDAYNAVRKLQKIEGYGSVHIFTENDFNGYGWKILTDQALRNQEYLNKKRKLKKFRFPKGYMSYEDWVHYLNCFAVFDEE